MDADAAPRPRGVAFTALDILDVDHRAPGGGTSPHRRFLERALGRASWGLLSFDHSIENGPDVNARHHSRWEPTPRWERRYREVLDAAASVFVEKSYAGASTRDIAERLGVRQASLYYYFPSKEAALAAICELGVKDFISNLQRHHRRADRRGGKASRRHRQPSRAAAARIPTPTTSASFCATATSCRTGRARRSRRWRTPIRI